MARKTFASFRSLRLELSQRYADLLVNAELDAPEREKLLLRALSDIRATLREELDAGRLRELEERLAGIEAALANGGGG